MTASWWGSTSHLPARIPTAVPLVPLRSPKGLESWGGVGFLLRAAFPCCLLAWPVLCNCVASLLSVAVIV